MDPPDATLSATAPPDLLHDAETRPSLGFHLSHQFLSGDRATRHTLAVLTQKLCERGVHAQDIENLELLLAEVLNNLSEHGYRGGQGPIDLSLFLHDDGIHCRIADQGRPIPAELIDSPALPHDQQPMALPEGGWGWFIINAMATNIGYEHAKRWNVLTMTLPWTIWPEAIVDPAVS